MRGPSKGPFFYHFFQNFHLDFDLEEAEGKGLLRATVSIIKLDFVQSLVLALILKVIAKILFPVA